MRSPLGGAATASACYSASALSGKRNTVAFAQRFAPRKGEGITPLRLLNASRFCHKAALHPTAGAERSEAKAEASFGVLQKPARYKSGSAF